jgi:thermostable 8-oxoguanine DNA glycosylase
MRFRKAFDFDAAQVRRLKAIVDRYYAGTQGKMPVPGSWRSMDSDTLWLCLIRIIIAIGRSDPSYRLVTSPDSGLLKISEMTAYQSAKGKDALVERTHGLLAKYGVRYCSPAKVASRKARVIVANLGEPVIVDGPYFVLLENLRRSREDPRFFLMDRVHGYGMKSASEFLLEIGYSQDYMAFDSRLKRVFSMIFESDFERIRTPDDYMCYEQAFREEICPELGVKPSQLDNIIFWNYGDILKGLKGESSQKDNINKRI